MLGKSFRAFAVGAMLLGFGVANVDACNGISQQLTGFVPQGNTGCYTQAIEYSLPAQPSAAFFYMAPEPQPQRAYVQQEVLGYAPQPVAQIGLAYATAQPVRYQQAKTAAVVGFAANPAYATGPPVALRGRFAGNPAVGAVAINGAAQLNTGQIVGTGRARVLRPTLFKRKVAGNVAAGNAVVGAVVVGNGY